MVEAVNEKGEDLSEIAKAQFDFRPQKRIIKQLIFEAIYQKTAAYGPFLAILVCLGKNNRKI